MAAWDPDEREREYVEQRTRMESSDVDGTDDAVEDEEKEGE